MNAVFWIIVAALGLVGALELKRRYRLKRQKTAKRRAAARGGLALERPQEADLRSGLSASTLALVLVFVALGGWAIFSFALSSPQNAAEAETAPPLEQEKILASSLSGQLGSEAQADMSTPLTGAMAEAARQMAYADSALKRAGRLAASEAKAPVAKERLQTKPAKPQESSRAAAKPQSASQKPSAAKNDARPAEPQLLSPAAASSSASASSAPRQASAPLERVPQPAEEGEPILSQLREFTVHLGSFGEKANAEAYRARLAAAGHSAFISETTVDGKRWYRVMSGRFASRAEADAHGLELKRLDLTTDTGRYLVKPLD